MKGLAILSALVLLAACQQSERATFTDMAITLPQDSPDWPELPDLPGRDAVIANCTACHSPSTMLQQPKVSREKWESQVTKMVEIYKAPIDPQAVPAIVDYMVAVQARQAKAQE
jgi:cytochrome c5